MTVWDVRSQGLDTILIPRLSVVSTMECQALLPLIGHEDPEASGDLRSKVLCRAPREGFSLGAAYRLAQFGGMVTDNAAFL